MTASVTQSPSSRVSVGARRRRALGGEEAEAGDGAAAAPSGGDGAARALRGPDGATRALA
jgi:hypothetical protein